MNDDSFERFNMNTLYRCLTNNKSENAYERFYKTIQNYYKNTNEIEITDFEKSNIRMITVSYFRNNSHNKENMDNLLLLVIEGAIDYFYRNHAHYLNCINLENINELRNPSKVSSGLKTQLRVLSKKSFVFLQPFIQCYFNHYPIDVYEDLFEKLFDEHKHDFYKRKYFVVNDDSVDIMLALIVNNDSYLDFRPPIRPFYKHDLRSYIPTPYLKKVLRLYSKLVQNQLDVLNSKCFHISKYLKNKVDRETVSIDLSISQFIEFYPDAFIKNEHDGLNWFDNYDTMIKMNNYEFVRYSNKLKLIKPNSKG